MECYDSVAPELARLYQLAWKPGRWMDAQWWPEVGLSAWRDEYGRHPSLRPALDAAIAKRRCFPAATLPSTLTSLQTHLMRLEPDLFRFVTALGLKGLNCEAYLLLGEYRRASASVLGVAACDQLLALPWPRGARPIDGIEPAKLVERAMALGHAWLGSQLGACPVWRALEIRLPPVESVALDVPADSAVSTLNRLERFL